MGGKPAGKSCAAGAVTCPAAASGARLNRFILLLLIDENFHQRILRGLIVAKRADAFFTCGSNRLMQLMKRVAREHGIRGQVAMEQVMACGLGPCYVCVRTFEVNGRKELRRVCIEGPVFDLQEAVGW